jgi:hypothetical protein
MLARLDPKDTTRAADVLPADWLGEEVFQSLGAADNVRAWVSGLIAGDHAGEALRVVVRVLPRNYVVAWGCERLRDHLAQAGPVATEADKIGLALAERCLRNPGSDACDAAIEFAEREEFGSAGAWLAAAAGWLEQGLAPRSSGTAVPAPDFLPGDAVAASLLWTVQDPAVRAAHLKKSVEHALRTFGSDGART